MEFNLVDSQNKIIETIKSLIIKESSSLFFKLKKNDNAFLEPLLFAFFFKFGKKKEKINVELLFELLQGYTEEKQIDIKYFLNKDGIAYIPNIGYFNSKKTLHKCDDIKKIKGTNIEILKYHIPLIDNILLSASNKDNIIDDFIIDNYLINKNLKYLTNAFSYIKKANLTQYNLINSVCKKCLIFKTDPKNTNSFSSINAHGIAFFNVYQEEYDEVFFVDDIAHQTGHIILTTLMFKREKYFLINENIGKITKNNEEYRSFYTLFHALYTYYTTLTCLDGCIENNSFKRCQINEAVGRIGFYCEKIIIDIDNFEKIINFYNGKQFVLTEDGIKIYDLMHKKFSELFAKWYHPITKNFNYTNQPYNFNYNQFIQLNK